MTGSSTNSTSMATGRTAPRGKPLSPEEQKSLTHGEFWIPETERNVYRLALETLNAAGVRYVVSGLYAIYEYTGIYRETKDLDLMLEPSWVVPAARALREAGFRVELTEAHWIAKAFRDGHMVDMVFGMGNGLAFIDERWHRHARPAILAATQVRVAPPEELIWHRLYISERHRTDMADVAHLILTRGDELDWERILERAGAHWLLLLAQVHLFDFVYPSHRGRIPDAVRTTLLERAREQAKEGTDPDAAFRGTLVSRFSFAIDVNEWGFRDLRSQAIDAARSLPIVQEIRMADVWQNDEPGRAGAVGRHAGESQPEVDEGESDEEGRNGEG